ncbi:hypothetical protein M378DRAFT_382392 [Amanita muscaria Koide BX008]|uniref:Uncharacterized protein n=1 Tax=Amanita muscaria (strain Koide BX008) TaxID=946122 RepID=A0A0C2WLA0_AMAMK|nr:hypothetical protein M378DRAFT_382392 [Amanita muscaria Koide BX008]
MPPRRKATTAAAPPALQEAQTAELDKQIQPPSSDDASLDNMVDVSAFLELGDTQPTAGPSSLPARPRRADKGKGRAILSNLASSPRSPTSPRAGPPHEATTEGNEHAAPAAPEAPPVAPPQLSPRRNSVSAPQTGRDRIPTILGRRRRDSRDIPPLSPERITLTRAVTACEYAPSFSSVYLSLSLFTSDIPLLGLTAFLFPRTAIAVLPSFHCPLSYCTYI